MDRRVVDSAPAAASLLLALLQQGFDLVVEDAGRLRIRPAERVDPALRARLAEQKAVLLPIVWRLQAMRATAGQSPVPVARLGAIGGPGRCFSCGDRLPHPEAYGRCSSCDIAVDLYYATIQGRSLEMQQVLM